MARNFKNIWGKGTYEGEKWSKENNAWNDITNHEVLDDNAIDYKDNENDDSSNEEGGIIGTNGKPIKFLFNNNDKININSKNVDNFTKKYLDLMSLTSISRNVLLEIRDSDIRVEIKNMNNEVESVLINSKIFSSLSGCVIAKEQYSNLLSYINGNIDNEQYLKNEKEFKSKALIENGSRNPSSEKDRVEFLKQEQYLEQVILINERIINTFSNPNREFFATALEESIHSMQYYIEDYYKSDNKSTYQDYEDLRHEKEAKKEVNTALIEYDKNK